jgi:hypothetical protein
MGPTEFPNGSCIQFDGDTDKRVLEILEEKIALLAVPILYVHLGFHADEDTD